MAICEVDLRSTIPQIHWVSPAEKDAEHETLAEQGSTQVSGPHGIPHMFQCRYGSAMGCKMPVPSVEEVLQNGHDAQYRIEAPINVAFATP
jgi:hypothetical protein